jgi:predicted nucleic acid-binding protein
VLPREGPIAIDTSLFIYFIEDKAPWVDIVDSLFEKVVSSGRILATSELTVCETLVAPLRAGDLAMVARYEELLGRSENVTLVPMDRWNLRAAANIRARFGLKTPDAIQLAAALSLRCTAFVTNDRRLPQIPGLRTIQLRELA